MFCCAFFGPAHMGSINYIYNPIDAAMYNAFAPIGWCAIFAWVIVMHHTGNTNGKNNFIGFRSIIFYYKIINDNEFNK